MIIIITVNTKMSNTRSSSQWAPNARQATTHGFHNRATLGYDEVGTKLSL